MNRPLPSGTIPRLLWCITVATMAKKMKMKRMKVCPSVTRYLSGEVAVFMNQVNQSMLGNNAAVNLKTEQLGDSLLRF